MKLKEWRNVFILVGFIVILTVLISQTIKYLPKRSEQYMAMSILGKNMLIDDYYPSDNTNITVDDPVHWNILLYNHMGEAQYLSVRIKLLSETMDSPNTTLCEASPVPIIYEIENILLKNETMIVPFTWSIIEAMNLDGKIIISKMNFNEHAFDTNITVDYGEDLRIVFELWIYRSQEETFSFTWENYGERRCVWNQIWFTPIA